MTSVERIYRKSAAVGASGFTLLIVLYDTLAGDLQRAAAAERRNDIGARCNEVNHALLVVGYLQDAVERSDGGELSQRLLRLYSSLRRAIMEAQKSRSAELLEQQMAIVLHVRETWQSMERPGAREAEHIADQVTRVAYAPLPAEYVSGSSSWSA
ncbi:MAG: flagellar protein FliS [Acidobacteriaceae bacterium]